MMYHIWQIKTFEGENFHGFHDFSFNSANYGFANRQYKSTNMLLQNVYKYVNILFSKYESFPPSQVLAFTVIA